MSIVGVDDFIIYPAEVCWIARNNGGYPYGITGTIANGADAGMARAKAFTEMPVTIPGGTTTTAFADNRVISTYRQGPNEAPSATVGFLVFDHTIITSLEDSTIYTDGEYDISWESLRCREIHDCTMILNGRAESQTTGSVGEMGWWTKIYPKVNLVRMGMTYSGQSAEAQPVSFEVTMGEVDTTPWGETIATNYGQTYGFATRPIILDYPITCHTFVGDNSTVEYTVDETPAEASGDKFPMWTDGSKETYTTDYAVVTATKTVTIEAGAKPGEGAVVINLYQYVLSC